VGRPGGGQRAQGGAFEFDLAPSARVVVGDRLGEEGAIGVEIGKAPIAAHEQRLFDAPLGVTVTAFDGAVLMGDAAIVARDDHAVVAHRPS
jgi:hypothetical protein